MPRALLLAALLASPLCGQVPPSLPAALVRELESVPVAASAAAQWQLAAEAAARQRRAAPAAVAAERRRAALHWIAVRARFPEERSLAAEAAFRAAEQLRILDEDEAALRELEFARTRAPDPELRARAGLELAHVERRRGGLERALDLYLAVSAQPDAPVRRRDEAALWVGKTYALLGRSVDAQRWLRHAAERATHALDRVRAHDEWAALHVALGDPEAAAGVIATCRVSLARVAEEETRMGELVRDALDRMRSIALVERAVARRRDASRAPSSGASRRSMR